MLDVGCRNLEVGIWNLGLGISTTSIVPENYKQKKGTEAPFQIYISVMMQIIADQPQHLLHHPWLQLRHCYQNY